MNNITAMEHALDLCLSDLGYPGGTVNHKAGNTFILHFTKKVHSFYSFKNLFLELEVSLDKELLDKDENFTTYVRKEIEKAEDDIIKMYEKLHKRKEESDDEDYLEYGNKYLYLRLEYALKNKEMKRLLDLSTYYPRASGKSITLAKLSQDYNIPVVYENSDVEKLLKRNIESKIGTFRSFNAPTRLALRVKAQPNRKTILIDELPTKTVNELIELGYEPYGLIRS